MKIASLPWIEDGIQGLIEVRAVQGLTSLADTGHTARLIDESWVVEGRNHPALEALNFLKSNHPETLSEVMSHPTMSDGITDQEAKVLATLGTAADPVAEVLDDHDLLDKLLDPEQVTLEERTITLPLAGETELTIIRIRPGVDRTMDLIEHSVRSIEEFMGLPFPRRQVIYLFVAAPGGGKNHSTHVQIRRDEQIRSSERVRAGAMLSLLAHETSHHYWRGLPRWIAEGAAVFMDIVVADRLHDPIETVLLEQFKPCQLVQTIAEFEDLEPDRSSFQYYDCLYSLAPRLLHDLYHNMDDTTFRLAFRRLFLHTVYNVPNECPDAAVRVTICHVREAFKTYVPEEAGSAVEDVITRWYGLDLPDASIRGVVTGPDGRSPGRTSLMFSHRVRGRFNVDVAPDGAYEVVVRSGSYVVQIRVAVGSEWFFVGWYDGKGSITTDPSQAFRVVVEGAAVEGVDIMLPTDAEGLLCPSGSSRSFTTGSCEAWQ